MSRDMNAISGKPGERPPAYDICTPCLRCSLYVSPSYLSGLTCVLFLSSPAERCSILVCACFVVCIQIRV